MSDDRSLTSGEELLAETVYGSAINYNDVRIHEHAYIPGMRISSPNGHIYYPSGNPEYDDDISTLDIYAKPRLH